jgi:hypothetical protein
MYTYLKLVRGEGEDDMVRLEETDVDVDSGCGAVVKGVVWRLQ